MDDKKGEAAMNKVESAIAKAWVHSWGHHIGEDGAVAVLRTLVDSGYIVVPKDPTMGMVMAGHEFCRRDPSYSMDSATRCYGAMIQAATQDVVEKKLSV